MASIYRPNGRKKYRITYADPATGKPVTVAGYRDKKATEELARRLERDAARAAEGLPVASRSKARTSVEEATTLYLAEMERQGIGAKHREQTEFLLRRLWRQCRWESLAGIKPAELLTFLHDLQAAGRGPRTLNAYRDAVRCFCEWCVDNHYLAENPIARVKRSRSRGKKTCPRRAYTIAEFKAMLTTPRHDAYEVAGLSGLRWGELRELEKRDVTPDGERPIWHLRPEIVKGRRRDVIPILPDLLPTIRRLWNAALDPTSKLLRVPRRHTWLKDQADAEIARFDSEGRRVDFHSFRYFFCTLLGRVLPIQKVKVLMRHKNIRETADLYTDLGLEDIAEDLWKVPQIISATTGATTPTCVKENYLK